MDPPLQTADSPVGLGSQLARPPAAAPSFRHDAESYRSRILVVEDDRITGGGLRRALEGEGYEVEWAEDGATALAAVSSTPADLVVLDLYLPDVDGLDVCQELRERFPSLPIVILSARTDEIDVVVGLNAGADDYLGKPFRLAEFLARLRAQLRRARPGGAGEPLTVGDLRIDPDARRVFVGSAKDEVALRPKEFDLLSLLASESGRGRVIRRDRIMKDVWGVALDGPSKSLDMHVSSLRHKLTDGGSTTRIITVRGAGYRLDP
jgi:DNA-binding response OmpR family regulator